jgi:hypothetical protein
VTEDELAFCLNPLKFLGSKRGFGTVLKCSAQATLANSFFLADAAFIDEGPSKPAGRAPLRAGLIRKLVFGRKGLAVDTHQRFPTAQRPIRQLSSVNRGT